MWRSLKSWLIWNTRNGRESENSRRTNSRLGHWTCSIKLATSPWNRETNCRRATGLSGGNCLAVLKSRLHEQGNSRDLKFWCFVLRWDRHFGIWARSKVPVPFDHKTSNAVAGSRHEQINFPASNFKKDYVVHFLTHVEVCAQAQRY
jgi:hypothetical protein